MTEQEYCDTVNLETLRNVLNMLANVAARTTNKDRKQRLRNAITIVHDEISFLEK